ncbi:glycosyltransferase family A protein [Bradyrhizobium sp. SZCCHNS1054]|uniref:glycosyltransferase family 2 protein n=1 Tax=Bradyrhizobium sp. SZCCHNS1054 TaxID=3057301 RepID=UPI0029169BDC|nr:glycosyltransferase family A protein [Bradyrhizobium sp. SZCCHNS1054]
MNDVAVIYLARLAEGFQPIEGFLRSYREHPAGIPHDLIILAKGFEKPGHFAALQALLGDVPHRVIAVDDDIGFDIHAYKAGIENVENATICCMNTFTTLRTDDWLKKLYDNFNKPDVGIVGATGSYESLYSSFKITQQIHWFLHSSAAMNRELARRFKWLLPPDGSDVRALTSVYVRARRMLGDFIRRRPSTARMSRQFAGPWATVLQPGSGLVAIRDFPAFPNPHIRTNVFMTSRKDFVSAPLEDKTKIACCRLESGPAGLTTSLRQRGLAALVVGANGKGYDIEQWPNSRCFRSGQQDNLLAEDNQTAAFGTYSAEEQKSLLDMTWAGYRSAAVPKELKVLGVPLQSSAHVREVLLDIKRDPSRTRFFSIVIPCRDRAELAADAIKTVLGQDYENYEICVFDNASATPVAPFLPSDNRVRVQRSETALHVTDSWNQALDMARGEYVTLVGDDDGLLPGFFERLSALADKFDDPDVIFSSLYQFWHPGVHPAERGGYLATMKMADFMVDQTEPFMLPRSEIERSVKNSLNFQRSFMFNMQAFTTKRSLLDAMRHRGKILRSPFPDYYFANAVLERASTVLCEPRPLAFQGISKVSFGSALFNSDVDSGFKNLGDESSADPIRNQLKSKILPGSRYQTEYLVTMGHVADSARDLKGQPNVTRYRKVQIFEAISKGGFRAAASMQSSLSIREIAWLWFVVIVRAIRDRTRLLDHLSDDIQDAVSPYSHRPGQVVLDRASYTKGSEVFRAVASGEVPVIRAA